MKPTNTAFLSLRIVRTTTWKHVNDPSLGVYDWFVQSVVKQCFLKKYFLYSTHYLFSMFRLHLLKSVFHEQTLYSMYVYVWIVSVFHEWAMGDIFNFLCSEKMSPDNQNLVICKKGVLHKTFFTNNRYILICFPQVFFFYHACDSY